MQRTANPRTSVRFRPGPPAAEWAGEHGGHLLGTAAGCLIRRGAAVAQRTVNPLVVGSNPTAGANQVNFLPAQMEAGSAAEAVAWCLWRQREAPPDSAKDPAPEGNCHVAPDPRTLTSGLIRRDCGGTIIPVGCCPVGWLGKASSDGGRCGRPPRCRHTVPGHANSRSRRRKGSLAAVRRVVAGHHRFDHFRWRRQACRPGLSPRHHLLSLSKPPTATATHGPCACRSPAARHSSTISLPPSQLSVGPSMTVPSSARRSRPRSIGPR